MKQFWRLLPQMSGEPFLTDGGMETTLVFHDRIDLPEFAAFPLLRHEAGKAALRRYYRSYAQVAARYEVGLILDSPTWRASADWGARLGYSPEDLAQANRDAVDLLVEMREEMALAQPLVISGCVGPRGDGYVPENAMTTDEAARYHRAQIETFADSAADMISAMTMNYTSEALGIAKAAQDAGVPLAISFTVETDGNLPLGQPLLEAIDVIDMATAGYPSYYMVNCAHPEHFEHVLEAGSRYARRIRGLRANASRMSHAELNESPRLDTGNPRELAELYARLRQERLPMLNIFGGCCGTDHRHVDAIAAQCVPLCRELTFAGVA